MTKVPTFFFSHARQDRETPGKYLTCFFHDLEMRLAQWIGVSLKETRLGTIDLRISQGADWDEALSRGLANDKVFVAILTPLYFNRNNCGKELGVFLLRSPGLGIDGNGALTGVRNLVPIRWMPENAYTANTTTGSLIPPILRRIEDTPADEGDDPERTKAIEKYRRKGMARCVTSQPEYDELLNLFAELIRDIDNLPSASSVSFATAIDAFNHDWKGFLASAGALGTLPAGPPLSVAAVMPRPLASVVVFYVTRRAFAPDPNPVDFADSLIAEASPDSFVSRDALFDALLADVRAAGIAEGITVFHAAVNPLVPITPERLLNYLIHLSELRVLTALVVDSAIWPAAVTDPGQTAIEEIVRSPNWTGPVMLFGGNVHCVDMESLATMRSLPARLVALPEESGERIAVLRRAFIDTRGLLLRMKVESAPNEEKVPILKAASTKRA